MYRLLFLFVLVCSAALSGCDPTGSACTYNGKVYSSGQTFPSSDGCNSCSCTADGQVACTLRACALQCTYNGTLYNPGEAFPSTDGCNSCACGNDGKVVCTTRACSGGCTYNGAHYSTGDSFPASDGCNTCTCAANGSVGCTKIACAVTQWLSLAPVQCQSNPWQKVTPKGDGTEPAYPIPELLTIDRFLRDQGIVVQELGLLSPGPGIATCNACSCARGDLLLLRARMSDVAALTSRFGFAAAAAGALSVQPRQCGANPWPAAQSPVDEAKNVATWAAGLGAPLSSEGFVYPTRTVAQCAACSCPRGDRLAVYPKDAAGAAILSGRGFVALP